MHSIKKIFFYFLFLSSSNVLFGQVNLTEAEYFWDTDPGQGNATAFAATDGSFNTAIENIMETSINVPAIGLHTFNVRVKNDLNGWGTVFTQVIDVDGAAVGTNAVVNLTEAEYFWDTDPGEGNGIAFAAEDGNFDSILEDLLETGIPIVGPVGLHVFNVRVKDSNNNWGAVFAQVIDIETTLSIDDNELDLELMVHPNPTTSFISIKTSSHTKFVNAKIYNINGGLVKTIDLKNRDLNTKINVEDLSNATYLMVIKSNKGQIIKKIIKK